MEKAIQYISDHQDRFLSELVEFLKIPSVSTKTEHKEDCEIAAEYLWHELKVHDVNAEIIHTDGNPIVYGRHHSGDDKPTVLVYGHYDVQPPEPLELWETPPFEPTIRDGKIYARGATDNKGQIYAHLKALDALRNSGEDIPVNIIYLIEGEEEIASDTLEKFIQENQEKLQCDVVLISDTAQYQKGIPCICYGLRGIHAVELLVENAKSDLHSGQFGGTIANPLEVLCQIIARMKDETGRILIPGFYDDVKPLEDWERNALAQLPWSDEQYKNELGVTELFGEEGYTTIERKGARPTFEINGIYGGYQGEGGKTVLPSSAGAKITMRLVANQTPDLIGKRFEEYVREIAPNTVTITVKHQGGGNPVFIPKDSPYMETAVNALRNGFDAEPVFIREGGSIPVVSALSEMLNVDAILIGFGLPDDNLHAPNEKFDLECFYNGIKTAAWFLKTVKKRIGLIQKSH